MRLLRNAIGVVLSVNGTRKELLPITLAYYRPIHSTLDNGVVTNEGRNGCYDSFRSSLSVHHR